LCSGFYSNGSLAVYAFVHAGLRRVDWVRRVVLLRAQASSPALLAVLALAGCTVGPDYFREPAPVPTTFKELKGWKVATPSDALNRGDWWAFYHDPKLAFLIKQVEISNQTVAASAAAYEEARALIREAQAALFPTVNGNYTFTRMRTGPNAGGGGNAAAALGATSSALYTTTIVPQFSGSWDLDIWGKVRRQIESNASEAQADAADLDNAKLSAQAALATAYFNLRAADSLRDLLTRTIAEYKKTLSIVQNQFNAGYSVTAGDVATARAQVETAEAQFINAGVQRAEDEHAIAMLIGRPPAELTIAPLVLSGHIPRIPVEIPSTLLERRPDIAAAERTMQEENALIGVAVAGYFPSITLSGLLEWIGKNPLPFNVANEVWSLGAAGSEVLFNGGLTSAQVDDARAVYWQSVANYRQTVLTAFQQVEDELAAVRLLALQLGAQQQAVKDQRTAVGVYLNQFQAGTVAFTTVVTAEIALLGDEETELTIRQNLFLASVSLIEALGGGWDSTLIPTQTELEKDISLLPQLPPNPPPIPPPNQ
jgi:NodT family efflux transporter outer membrane factor (OMF) lipoprotein